MHYQADTSISIGENLSNCAFISRNMYENQPIDLDIYFFKEVNVSFWVQEFGLWAQRSAQFKVENDE